MSSQLEKLFPSVVIPIRCYMILAIRSTSISMEPGIRIMEYLKDVEEQCLLPKLKTGMCLAVVDKCYGTR